VNVGGPAYRVMVTPRDIL